MTVWASHDAAPGATKLTYRVHYANLSRDASASRVVMHVAAPDGAKLVRVPPRSTVLLSATEVDLDLGPVAPLASGALDVDVAWDAAPAPGAWTELKATIAAAEHDPDPSNNTAADGERVPAPDLFE